MNDEISWLFVVDTDSYAGNFERAMCAYMTGQVGDCGVGKDYAELFKKEVKDIDFIESVAQEVNDDGCPRPTSIFLSKDSKKYNSIVIYFYQEPSTEEKRLMKERAIKFSNLGERHPSKYIPALTVLGFRLIKKTILYKEVENSVLMRTNKNELL